MAALRQAVRINRATDFFARVPRPPVSVIHLEGTGLAEFLMPDVVRGSNCQSPVPSGRLNVNLFERCGVKDLSVRDAIESHAACETYGFEPGSLTEFF